MSRTHFPFAALSGLIILGLLILGGFAIHRLGWSEGYSTGLAAGLGDGAVVPYPPSGSGLPGFLLTALLIVLLLGVAGRFFRFLAWGPWMMAGRPGKAAPGEKGSDWARRWHRHHPSGRRGPVPPWCWDWEEPSEAEAEETESDAEAANAQA